MGILGDWTAYNVLNTYQALIDKVKTSYLQFSNSVLPLKKGNPLVSTPVALVIRFIVIITSKCLKRRVINNFIITRSVYYFLSNGKQEDKDWQLVKTMFFSRVLQDKFYNKKNKETIVNQFLYFYKSTILKRLEFFVWAILGTLIKSSIIDICWFIISGLLDLDWASA